MKFQDWEEISSQDFADGYAAREGFLARRHVARAALGQVVYRAFGADDRRMAKVREASLRVARGWDQVRLRALVEDTLAEVIEPIVYDEAPVWFFNYNKAVMAYQPWVKGLQANATELTHQYPEYIWVTEDSPAK